MNFFGGIPPFLSEDREPCQENRRKKEAQAGLFWGIRSKNDVDLVAGQELVQAVEHDLRAQGHGLLRGEGHVRGDDGVGRVEQRMRGVQRRLDLEDVNARAADAALVQASARAWESTTGRAPR